MFGPILTLLKGCSFCVHFLYIQYKSEKGVCVGGVRRIYEPIVKCFEHVLIVSSPRYYFLKVLFEEKIISTC